MFEWNTLGLHDLASRHTIKSHPWCNLVRYNTSGESAHRSFHYRIISRALLTVRGVRYALGVLVQQPSLEARLGLDPLLLSLRQRLIIDEQVDRVLVGIDDDLIAVLDQGDRPAVV